MSLPDPKTQILETIKLIEKHNLPFEPVFTWCIMESIANGFFLIMATQVRDEAKLFQFIKEWSDVCGVPVTDEQLETYKQRYKYVAEVVKQRTSTQPTKEPEHVEV